MSQQRIASILKAGIVLLLLALSGWSNRASGWEISLFPLYAVPIGLAVWFFGGRAGYAAAVLAAVIWLWADVAAGHVYSRPWIVYVNTASRLMFFLIAALAADGLVKRHRARAVEGKSLPAVIPVCTGCGKVSDRNGYWWDMRVYVREHADPAVRTKLCNDCAREAYVEHDDAREPESPLAQRTP